jgi:uncharacterized membrane protein YhaH (DUF805 family)
MLAPFQSMMWLGVLLRLVYVIPMFALFVRRLHDQNRSGWWGLLLPLALLLSIPGNSAFDGIIPQTPSPYGIALEIVCIAVLVLFLLPGTVGSNRFGLDPRLEQS